MDTSQTTSLTQIADANKKKNAKKTLTKPGDSCYNKYIYDKLEQRKDRLGGRMDA